MDRLSDPGRERCTRSGNIESSTSANTLKLEQLRALLTDLYQLTEAQIVAIRLNTMNVKRAAMATEQLDKNILALVPELRELNAGMKDLGRTLTESNSAVIRLAEVLEALYNDGPSGNSGPYPGSTNGTMEGN